MLIKIDGLCSQISLKKSSKRKKIDRLIKKHFKVKQIIKEEKDLIYII